MSLSPSQIVHYFFNNNQDNEPQPLQLQHPLLHNNNNRPRPQAAQQHQHHPNHQHNPHHSSSSSSSTSSLIGSSFSEIGLEEAQDASQHDEGAAELLEEEEENLEDFDELDDDPREHFGEGDWMRRDIDQEPEELNERLMELIVAQMNEGDPPACVVIPCYCLIGLYVYFVTYVIGMLLACYWFDEC